MKFSLSLAVITNKIGWEQRKEEEEEDQVWIIDSSAIT
jgi:hypothetical protein